MSTFSSSAIASRKFAMSSSFCLIQAFDLIFRLSMDSCIFSLDAFMASSFSFSSVSSCFVDFCFSLSKSAFCDSSVIPNSCSIISRCSACFVDRNGCVYVFKATMFLNMACVIPNSLLISACVSLFSPWASLASVFCSMSFA